jgi:hypothetical protein
VERTGLGVIAVMRAAAKTKQQSFKGQFSKFIVVANSKFGDGLLDEIGDLCLHPSQYSFLYCGALTNLTTPFYKLQNIRETMRSPR